MKEDPGTDRQTDRQTERQTDRNTDRQTDRLFPSANHQTKKLSKSPVTAVQKVILNQDSALLFGPATPGLTYYPAVTKKVLRHSKRK